MEGLQKRYLLDEREKMINYGNVRRETKKITIIANPALRMLYLPMIFKTWKSFSDKKNKGLLSEDDENEVIVIKDTRKTKVSFSFLDLFKNKLS